MSSICERVAALLNCPPLWLLAYDLNKFKPGNILAQKVMGLTNFVDKENSLSLMVLLPCGLIVLQ